MNNKKVEIKTVNIGEIKSLITEGIFFSKNLSRVATMYPIISATMIPP